MPSTLKHKRTDLHDTSVILGVRIDREEMQDRLEDWNNAEPVRAHEAVLGMARGREIACKTVFQEYENGVSGNRWN